jgi:hypothetical protein
MQAIYDPAQAAHAPEFFLVKGVARASTEQPERAERLLAGLAKLGVAVAPADDFGPGRLAHGRYRLPDRP